MTFAIGHNIHDPNRNIHSPTTSHHVGWGDGVGWGADIAIGVVNVVTYCKYYGTGNTCSALLMLADALLVLAKRQCHDLLQI